LGPLWTAMENLALTRVRFPTVHPVACRYSDYALPVTFCKPKLLTPAITGINALAKTQAYFKNSGTGCKDWACNPAR